MQTWKRNFSKEGKYKKKRNLSHQIRPGKKSNECLFYFNLSNYFGVERPS